MSHDFRKGVGRQANVRKMDLRRPETFLEAHQALLRSPCVFAGRDGTWMRRERSGGCKEGWASENPGLSSGRTEMTWEVASEKPSDLSGAVSSTGK